MARPKGSKNRKPVISSVKIEDQITAQKQAVAALNSDLDAINAGIKEQQLLAKDKKKEIRKAEKVLASLVAKKEQSDAIEAAAAQKAEIEKVVTQLLSSGKSAEEILSQLK